MRRWIETGVVVGILSLFVTTAQATKEEWYVERGRANMDIGNYRAAIEALEKATSLNPNHREAMEALGMAYEKSGLTDKAIQQFDRYLERFPDDAEVALAQAQRLSWDRYAYRRDDALRYYRVGLEGRRDPKRRHAFARLLAQRRENLDEAVAQYELLLEQGYQKATVSKEYRKLLQWDPKHRRQAVEAQRARVEEASTFEERLRLADLLARDERVDEALTLYATLVQERPTSQSARTGQARLLARDRQFDKAQQAYEQVLQNHPTPALQREYGDVLAARASTRPQAAEVYRKLLKKNPQDTATRLRYAAILGARRDTAEQAITQYQAVVRQAPRSAAAHRGLAKAYAWTGDAERARHHARVAQENGARVDADFAEFAAALDPGSENVVVSDAGVLTQPGAFQLDRLWLGARGQWTPTPGLSLQLRAGFENLWGPDQTSGGAYATGQLNYSLGGSRRIEARIGYRGFPTRSLPLSLGGSYQFKQGAWTVRPGFNRRLRNDSYVALVGRLASDGTRAVGAARENTFFVEATRAWGALEVGVRPVGGWVTAVDEDPNLTLAAAVWTRYRVVETARVQVTAGARTHWSLYRRDHAALDARAEEPLGGGYFSPQFFIDAAPEIAVTWTEASSHTLEVRAAPALQYYRDASATTWQWGVSADARLAMEATPTLRWGGNASAERIADVYERYRFGVFLEWLL